MERLGYALLLNDAAHDLEQKLFFVRLICDGYLLNSSPHCVHSTNNFYSFVINVSI